MNKNRLVLPTDFEQGDNLTYQNINDAFESINRFNAFEGTINIEYIDLFNLSQNGKLIPGAFYRITNYTASVISGEMASAGHYFDVIVQAISETKLSQHARAIQNENDPYFDGANLQAWQLKYELGNPVQLKLYKNDYAQYQAGEEDFQDVDYADFYQYDGTYEYDGETYYKFLKYDSDQTWGWWILTDTLDFSGVSMENPYTPIATIARDGEIVFGDEQYKGEDKIVYVENNTSDTYKGDILYMKDEFNNECYYDFKNILFKRYHIDEISDNSSQDSLNESLLNTYLGIKNNVGYTINEEDYIYVYTFGGETDGSLTDSCYNNNIQPAGNMWRPNNITFNENSYDNYIFSGSYNCSFSHDVYCNIIGHAFMNNTFGNSVGNNTFGNNIGSNSFGNDIWNNSFGNSIHNNSFGNEIYENTFGNNIWHNSFGNKIYRNSFGNGVTYNSFGNSVKYNTFGNSVGNNTFGNYIYQNTFGNVIQFNTFGNDIWYNSFGNNIGSNSFGNYFQYNTIENHMIYAILGSYIRHAKFLSGLSFDSATSITGILTSVSYCQYIGKNSAGEVIIKNPMD